jgi:hypothetical protein
MTKATKALGTDRRWDIDVTVKATCANCGTQVSVLTFEHCQLVAPYPPVVPWSMLEGPRQCPNCDPS